MTALIFASAAALLAGGESTESSPTPAPLTIPQVAAVMPSAINGDFAGVAMDTAAGWTFQEQR